MQRARVQAWPLLEAEGTRVIDVGDRPHLGAVTKLMGEALQA